MSSAEKEIKKSPKFSYLKANEIKQQLLGRYETLNFEPVVFRRKYNVTQTEKNKQNVNENQNYDFIDESKYLTENESKQLKQQSDSRNKLVSFSKNNRIQQNSRHLKQKQFQMNHFSINQQIQKKSKQKYENIQRIRNKSFGNISFKKSQLQNSQQQSIKRNSLEFSPYQQQKGLKQLPIQNTSNMFKSINLQRKEQKMRKKQPKQKLLIYELQEQHLIIKKQLKQYEYQNDLLRKKIQYLEGDNIVLKQKNQQLTNQIQQQENHYQNLLQKQSLNISKLHEQIEKMSINLKDYENVINQDKFLIKDLQNQITSLNSQLAELEIVLDSKQELIHQMKNKLDVLSVGQRSYGENQGRFSRRRKSLDLSMNPKRLSPNKDHLNDINIINLKQYQSSQSNSSQFRLTSNASTAVGKLINKTISYTLNPIQENKPLEKQSNFIESIKSMYFKINNQQSKDLKQLWKWLKFIAHQYQAFSQIYTSKDAILAVLDDFQTQNLQLQTQNQLSFMQKECHKIIKKLSQIVKKHQN